MKRTIKDSVFRDLFSDEAHALELYRCLFPHDKEVSIQDVRVNTLKTVVLNGIYNDFSMDVRDRILVFCEEQSAWSDNVVYRLYQYSADVYRELVARTGQDQYGRKRMNLPEPKFYVIYTGTEPVQPEINLEKVYGWSRDSMMTLRAEVITRRNATGILKEYLDFVDCLEKNIRIHGRNGDAVRATIDACIQDGILVDYLTERRVEVVRIMEDVLSQEYALKMHDWQFEKEIERIGNALAKTKDDLAKKDDALAKTRVALAEKDDALAKKDSEIMRLKALLERNGIDA